MDEGAERRWSHGTRGDTDMSLSGIQAECQRAASTSSLGRYSLHNAIAVGEVTSVHLGILEGVGGFRRTVVIKRLLPRWIRDRAAIAGLAYEACVAAPIQHPNVAAVLDLGTEDKWPYLVREYVFGETLAQLLRMEGRCPLSIAVSIVAGMLRGLDAAHIARDAAGRPLEIVHRNICPENVLVGADGTTRIIDFGSALSSLATPVVPFSCPPNAGCAAPEQVLARPVDRRADIFAAAVVLWELVAGTRPFRKHRARDAFLAGATRTIPPASAFNVEVPPELEAAMDRALHWSPARRFDSAAEFADELELAVTPATRAEVAAYVENVAATNLAVQRNLLRAMSAPFGWSDEPSYDGAGSEPTQVWPSRGERWPLPVASKSQTGVRYRFAGLASQVTGIFSRTSRSGRFALHRAAPGLAAQQASAVFAGASLVCLLLAGVHASLGRPVSLAHKHPLFGAAELRHASSDLPHAPPELGTPLPSEHPAAVPHASAVAATTEDRVRGRPPPRTRGTGPRADQSACDPPFSMDAAGIRRMKPDCL